MKKNAAGFTKENMNYLFNDLDGNQYYGFDKEVSMPVVRLGKLQEYYAWLSAGITGEELSKLMDEADKALTDGLVNKKGVAKIGFIISEIKDRKNMIVHPELYYNIIAAQLIRHDEKINDFNNEIQMQKVEAFKKMDLDSDTFFLITRELLGHSNLLNMSIKELRNLFRESESRIKAMGEMMNRI